MMSRRYRLRLFVTLLIIAMAIWLPHLLQQPMPQNDSGATQTQRDTAKATLAHLEKLDVKGRAPKTNYARSQFGDGWLDIVGCDTRNTILARDLENPKISASCLVLAGTLHDPYTAKTILFQRGESSSSLVQIDHVVSLSDAWQKGAQQLSYQRRIRFANDPLNLLAVDGQTNQDKSDGDAATWLPPNKPFRCQYVTRQIKVKQKYTLWVVEAEKQAMQRILRQCI